MKNKLLTFLQIASLAAIFSVTVFAAQAGTAEDPIVTKSYVDKCINDAVNQMSSGKLSESEITSIAKKAAELVNTRGSKKTDDDEDDESPIVDESALLQPSTYKAVELKAGKVLLGEEGTEVIVRSGICFVHITGADTMLDVTTGQSLVDKNSISKDHLLIIPRADGRGVRATENSWLLVKGGYSVTDYTP